MAIESDPGTPTAPEAAPAVEAPADAAPAAEPIGTEDGTEAVESSEASDLGIDGNLPEFELSGPLTNLAPAVQAEIHRMIGDRDKVVQDKLKDMQRGFTGKTTALAESRKALEAQIATLAEGSESWEALSSGDPSRMAELINTLPEVKAKILELAGTPTTQGAEDSNAKLLKWPKRNSARRRERIWLTYWKRREC